MPKTAGQKVRMFHVLSLLFRNTDEEHGLTVAQLLESLAAMDIKADRKTLYDDIEQLRLLDFDIQNERGKDGGYRLVSRDFELSELVLLTDAVQSSRFITEKKSAALIKKLSNLTSVHQGKQLARKVQVSGRIRNMDESIFYSVDTVHAAINNDRQISFNYYDYDRRKEKIKRHGGKTYVVSPISLCWDDEYYYLVAKDEEQGHIKHYRVDKMLKVTVLKDKPRSRESVDFDMGPYTDKLFGMFGGEERLVTLRCKDDKAGVIIDRFGKDVPFRLFDDGHFEITAKVILSPVFYGWILGFGTDITVTSPKEAREELKRLANNALEAYKED